jgi:hypothetical protein
MLRRYALAALTLGAATLIAAGCEDAVAPRGAIGLTAARFSNGLSLGQCFLQAGDVPAPQVAPGSDGNAVVSAPTGEVVLRVAIKAGTPCWFTPDGATGTYTVVVEGAPCYVVAGLGTPTATVARVGNGPDCKDISHVEFVSGVPLPTTGLLQICVMVVGENPPPSTLVDPFAFLVAGQEIDVAHGHCATPVEEPAGAIVIAQQPTLFVSLSNAVSVPDGRVVSVDVPGSSATVTVVAGTTTVVTITMLWVPDPGLDG